MPNVRKSKWSDLRKRLLLLGHKELIAQIKDLYAISDENRRFLEARFAQGQGQVQAVLADYKQDIIYCFFGERGINADSPRLRDARRLIRDYRKATKDSSGTLDLMLHNEKYELSVYLNGKFIGAPEEAFLTSAMVYLDE